MTIITKKSLYLNASGSNVISSDVHASGTMFVGGTAELSGNVTINGELTGSGNVLLNGAVFMNGPYLEVNSNGGEVHNFAGATYTVSGTSGLMELDGGAGTFTVNAISEFVGDISFGSGIVEVNATAFSASSIVPRTTSQSLGSSTAHWDTLYVDNIVGAGTTPDLTNVSEIGVSGSLVISSSANLSVLGTMTADSINVTNDLTVGGNLTVNGTQTILNVTELVIEDKLITLASGNNSDAGAVGAGIEVQVVGGDDKWIKYTNTPVNAWTTNIDWSPSADNTINLGNASLQWHDLFIGGSSLIGGSTQVSGETILLGGLAVTGTGSFSGNVTSNGYLISPISVVTTSLGSGLNTAMFTTSNLGIADGEILKAKLEVLALSEDKADACSWELSIVGSRNGSTVAGDVIEIIKLPITGSTAPNFDLVVEVVANGLKVSVNDASQGGNVRWYGQITKKMIINISGSVIA